MKKSRCQWSQGVWESCDLIPQWEPLWHLMAVIKPGGRMSYVREFALICVKGEVSLPPGSWP